jgi:hypothetical protein
MQRVRESLIRSALGFGLIALSGCAETVVQEIPVIETRTIEVQRPSPIVPTIDQLRLRNVEWKVVTPENVDEIFASLEEGEVVLFALTAEGYENLSLNLSDLRANIQQQQEVIAVFRESYRR